MQYSRITFTGANDTTLPGILWMPETEPKAIIQIAHGMTEHIGRYAALANYLTTQGIVVAGFDLRGHGNNFENPYCASFGEKGWESSVEDLHLLYEFLNKKFPDLPHFMLGFSLGSFLLREYLNRFDDKIAGAAILGTGYQPKIILSFTRVILKTQIHKAGFDETTPLVKKLSFEAYNRKFAPNRTPCDWLCSDKRQQDLYRSDSLCRENISAGLFWQLLGSMKRTGSLRSYHNWNKNFPILLLSGDKDPVGNFGKGVHKVHKKMMHAGIKNVELHMLPEARHDILHEDENGGAQQARTIISEWILKNIKA
ncbi:MAG: alpha/beta fold hydrolase [Schaedlerella sp.]|nr:alpha/beta fold hydrolase [Schaedlerella sp.]